jgi:TRAP-type C4-dicarboxylate transport system substrate-binding protein
VDNDLRSKPGQHAAGTPRSPDTPWARWRTWAWAAAAVSACIAAPLAARAQDAPAQHLRIVGGLAGVTQYKGHEEPFWTKDLARLSGGRATAEIVPYDLAGLRGQEVLRLVQLGVVQFGTSILNLSAGEDAELGMPDLAGLNPDMGALRRTVAAYRPQLKKMLRDRYGIELLAIYAYPAQVTFCSKSLGSLADLSGRRIRISSATQADWVTALGAKPVQLPFTEVVANMRNGNIDCAITASMSGNALGLHEVAGYLQTTPVNWGLAAFIANGNAWAALTPDVQQLLQRELPKLEQAIWADAETETRNGSACNTGAATCTGGRKGRMTEVPQTAADMARGRDILMKTVLPGWLKRCGPQCAATWKQVLGPTTGVELR